MGTKRILWFDCLIHLAFNQKMVENTSPQYHYAKIAKHPGCFHFALTLRMCHSFLALCSPNGSAPWHCFDGKNRHVVVGRNPAYHLGCTKLLILSILGYTNTFKGVPNASSRVSIHHPSGFNWHTFEGAGNLLTGDRRITEPSTVGWQVVTRKFWRQDFSKIHGNPFDSVESARIGCHLQGEIHAVCSWCLWTWLKNPTCGFFSWEAVRARGHFWVDHLSHISQVRSEMCGLPCISVLKTQGFLALRRPNLRK